MNVLKLMLSLKQFLENPIDGNLLIDTGNTPYVSISFMYLEDGIAQNLSFGKFLNVTRDSKTQKRLLSTTYQQEKYISLSKQTEGNYIENLLLEKEDFEPFKTDDCYCDQISLSPSCKVIITVVASPQDTQFFFKHIRMRLEILHNHI